MTFAVDRAESVVIAMLNRPFVDGARAAFTSDGEDVYFLVRWDDGGRTAVSKPLALFNEDATLIETTARDVYIEAFEERTLLEWRN